MQRSSRSPLDIVLAVTAAGAAVWLLHLLFHLLFTARGGFGGSPMPPLAAAWLPTLGSGLLLAAALAWPVLRSAHRGRRLALDLFVAVLGVHVVLVVVEAILFLDFIPASDVALGTVQDVLVAVVLTAVLTATLGRPPRPSRDAPAPGPSFGAWGWVWRLAVCALAYLVLYFTAGALIWEQVRPYYEGIGLEPGLIIFPTQIVRGTLYVLFTLPLLRALVLRRWQASLAVAVMYPLLAGVSVLIVPNPVMPGWVRGWHLMEIGWSNFVFGALVGFLFWNPRAGVRRAS